VLKAVILAAGIGSRLSPITDNKPKCMVKVCGKPIIDHALEQLQDLGIDEVVICAGYKAGMLIEHVRNRYENLVINFVVNEDYETTNNMYSFYLARRYLASDVLLMNGDVLFEPSILESLYKQAKTQVAVDVGRFLPESMKVTVQNHVLTGISKKITKSAAFGTAIDIYYFARKDVRTLIKIMEQYIVAHEDVKQWTEVALDEAFSQGLIKAQTCDVEGRRWFEVDTIEDLIEADMLFNEKISQLKYRKIFFLDKDGTLVLGGDMIQGTDKFISWARMDSRNVKVLTNNSSNTHTEHYRKLLSSGLDFSMSEIISSLQSAIEYLSQKRIVKVYFLANKRVSKYLKSQGIEQNSKDPEALLMTWDTELTYDKLKQFCLLVDRGIPYYATHPDITCPTDEGLIPDIGTFLAMVKLTTGRNPDLIFGKPCVEMIKPTLDRLHLTVKDAVIIGDRLYTDIRMGIENDILTVLVLSGETDRAQYEDAEFKADIIVPNLGRLAEILSG
jgi:HAD superfamily hydrolase (TIGR01450 family)